VNSSDPSYDSYTVDIWCAVEINTGLFCVSAPAIKPLLRKFAPGLLGSMEPPSIPLSKTRSYGASTFMSRVRNSSDGFELSSQTNLEYPVQPHFGVNRSWIDVEGQEKGSSDNDSERVVKASEIKEGEIRKTTRVMVSTESNLGQQ